MNFYKHHIGDFDQATRHLSFVEDAAYSRLIRKYYAEERPLPKDLKKILRLIGARTKEEKSAVEAVLEEFFVLMDDGWHQTRCDEELEAARAKAEKNREIGKLGGRPRKVETQKEPTGNPDGFHSITQTVSENNPSQTPDSSNQTPDTRSHKPETPKGKNKDAPAALELPDWLPEDAWGAFVAMRKKIKAPLTDEAVRLAIEKLGELMQSGHRPRAVLEQSTLNSWRGLFEIKTGQRSSNDPDSRQAFNERENAKAKQLLFGPEVDHAA